MNKIPNIIDICKALHNYEDKETARKVYDLLKQINELDENCKKYISYVLKGEDCER